MYYFLMLSIEIPDKIQSPKIGQFEREGGVEGGKEKDLGLL